MLKVIKQINVFIKEIPEKTIVQEKVDTRSLLNFALTDGHSVICTRYVSSKTDEAASLYYSSGTTWDDKKKGNFQMDRRDKGADIVLVASEPLTFERDNWVTVPTNSILTIHKQTVMVHPIIDEYYNQNPAHHRSSQYVAEKGLITNKSADKTCVTPSVACTGKPSRASPLASPLASPSQETPKHNPLTPSRLSESLRSPSANSRNTERSNENTTRHLSMISSRDPSRPQEQGNTKKKRVSIEPQGLGEPDLEFITGNIVGNAPLTPNHNRFSRASTSTIGSREGGGGVLGTTRETGYGSPAKINQYFPELS